MKPEQMELYGLRQLETGEWVVAVPNPEYPIGPATVTLALNAAELEQLMKGNYGRLSHPVP